MKSLYFLCYVFAFVTTKAQNTKPCSAPQIKQFDFWIGDWDLTWSDTLHGTNWIEKIMDGCTLQENFYDPHNKYVGKSWSVYNPNKKEWQQTWVDDGGGYIALTGGMVGDSMVLTAQETTTPRGKTKSRMVYYNITPQSVLWNWESSADGGITWKLNWKIHYQRKR